jgi:hypothetical protein
MSAELTMELASVFAGSVRATWMMDAQNWGARCLRISAKRAL